MKLLLSKSALFIIFFSVITLLISTDAVASTQEFLDFRTSFEHRSNSGKAVEWTKEIKLTNAEFVRGNTYYSWTGWSAPYCHAYWNGVYKGDISNNNRVRLSDSAESGTLKIVFGIGGSTDVYHISLNGITVDFIDPPSLYINFSDKTTVEGSKTDLRVAASFPSGIDDYQWQFSHDGVNWEDCVDGDDYSGSTTNEMTAKTPTINYTLVDGLRSPHAYNGIKYRCVCKSNTNGVADTVSDIGTLTVNPKSLSGIEATYKYENGDIGEIISTSNVSIIAKFNNDTSTAITGDELKYIKFIKKPASDVPTPEELTAEASNKELTIKKGDNTFYVLYTYTGNPNGPQTKWKSFTVTGIDKSGPELDNIDVFDTKTGEVLTAKSFCIAGNAADNKVAIRFNISDNCDDYKNKDIQSSDISYEYTERKTDVRHELQSIGPVPQGGKAEIPVQLNGLYTIYVTDSNNNTSSTFVSVNVFDEHDPVATHTLKGVGGVAGSTVYKSYELEIKASDKEMLHPSPYTLLKFDSAADAAKTDAEDYIEENRSSIREEAVQRNVFNITESGYYVYFVSDKCGRMIKSEVVIEIKANSLDNEVPVIKVTPKHIDGATLPKYDILVTDNLEVYNWTLSLKNEETGVYEQIQEIMHNHSAEKEGEHCRFSIKFEPTKKGEYKLEVKDKAGNTAKKGISVAERKPSGIVINGVPQSKLPNSEIALQDLIKNGQIVIKFNDSTEEVYAYLENERVAKKQNKYTVTDDLGSDTRIWGIASGDNVIKVVLTNTEDGKQYSAEEHVIGTDNIAPSAGTLDITWIGGDRQGVPYDGSITNDTSYGLLLEVIGYSDNNTAEENLVFEWFCGDTPIANSNTKSLTITSNDPAGVYNYTITDEFGSKTTGVGAYINAWDTKAPTGTVQVTPSIDGPAKWKELSIIDVQDDNGLADRAYSISTDAGEEIWQPVSKLRIAEDATYYVKIQDAVGNKADLGSYKVTGVDNEIPMIQSIGKVDGEPWSVNVNASDNCCNAGELEFSTNGETWQSGTKVDYAADTFEGTHSIYVRDRAGNQTSGTFDVFNVGIEGYEEGSNESGVSENGVSENGVPSANVGDIITRYGTLVVLRTASSETKDSVNITSEFTFDGTNFNVSDVEENNNITLILSNNGEEAFNSADLSGEGLGKIELQVSQVVESDTKEIPNLFAYGDEHEIGPFSINVDNIDKEEPKFVAVGQGENNAPSINISVTDDKGINKVEWERPDGLKEMLNVYERYSTSGEIQAGIFDKGVYKIKVTDRAGNYSEQSVTIDSIKGTDYTLEELAAAIRKMPTSWTNASVSLIAELDKITGLGNTPFRWNGGAYTNRPMYNVRQNGDVTFNLKDIYGNVIGPVTINVNNIDRNKPEMSPLLQKASDKNKLIINATDELSGIKLISVYGENLVDEYKVQSFNEPVKAVEKLEWLIPTNGTYTIKVYDAAGNSVTEQLKCTGVTTDAPKVVEVEKEVIKEVEKEVIKEVEKVVEVPAKPITIPVTVEVPAKPITREVIKNVYTNTVDPSIIESNMPEVQVVEVPVYVNSSEQFNGFETTADSGEMYTEDGEILMRIDPKLKETNPLLYEFKKHSEGIAVGSSIGLLLALLALLIVAVALLSFKKKYKAEKALWNQSEMHDVVDGVVSRMIKKLENHNKGLEKKGYSEEELRIRREAIEECIEIQRNMEL